MKKNNIKYTLFELKTHRVPCLKYPTSVIYETERWNNDEFEIVRLRVSHISLPKYLTAILCKEVINTLHEVASALSRATIHKYETQGRGICKIQINEFNIVVHHEFEPHRLHPLGISRSAWQEATQNIRFTIKCTTFFSFQDGTDAEFSSFTVSLSIDEILRKIYRDTPTIGEQYV